MTGWGAELPHWRFFCRCVVFTLVVQSVGAGNMVLGVDGRRVSLHPVFYLYFLPFLFVSMMDMIPCRCLHVGYIIWGGSMRGTRLIGVSIRVYTIRRNTTYNTLFVFLRPGDRHTDSSPLTQAPRATT